MKFYKLSEVSEIIGMSTVTLRLWIKNKKLNYTKTQGNHYLISEEELNRIFNLKPKQQNNRKIIGYCRVSSKKQEDDLKRQVEYVRQYCVAKGYSFEIIEDIGSGINYNKNGLNTLINLIIQNKVEKVVVLYKDRLVRFGFELIENICRQFNTGIEIIDNTEKTEEQEVVEDMIQIITVFSCKLQGKRANKAKKILKELKENGDT